MFHDDDTAGEEEAHTLMQLATPRLVEELERIGLYVSDMSVLQRAAPDGGVQSALQIQAVLGRLALSPRVQDPAQEDVDARFDLLAEQFVVDEYERRRRELGG